jgi:PAS domain S-box-containing protein
MNQGARTVELNPLLSQVSLPAFLDQVQDGLCVVDREQRIVLWNRSAYELTGFKPADVVGRTCTELLALRSITGESLASVETDPLARCMHSGIGGIVPQIILMATVSGKSLPVSLSVGPLHGAGGATIGVIALFRSMREEYQQRRLAVEIQKRTITQGGFTRNGVRVDTLYAPLDEIGGDFLEAFFLDERTLIATLADATGHGISASLFTMVYKSLLHGAFARHQKPSSVLENVNRAFLETAGIDGFYVGACLVRYNPVTREGAFSAAGHPRGLLFAPREGGYSLRDTVGVQSLMLGMDDQARFKEVDFRLADGELLLLVSDGMLESPCRDGGQFGLKGIEAFFSRFQGGAPLDGLLTECRRCGAFDPLGDDVSAILLSPS